MTLRLSMLVVMFILIGCGSKSTDQVVLRVCNWEEYIDEGDWDEDELIELENGTNIIGKEPIYREFEKWYRSMYGVDVRIEYSTFGTNEDLYNQLTIGDTFDLVCPSEYMIMKLMAEKELEPYSDEFFDESREHNYYVRGVSPYIKNIFTENKINDETWGTYAAGYMWGTTGIVYNPEEVSVEDASHWNMLLDNKFYRQVTVKDNVRDSYFAGLAMHKQQQLMSSSFIESESYNRQLTEAMNDTSDEVIDSVQAILKQVKDNTYSFETDSAKADMITGKVVASYQWSGDAVYTMEQAEEDGVELHYTVPEECGNLWFDGWVMLKRGIKEHPLKQQVAEAFVNYLSRPDNAVRNMYYIGYTSVISGGEDDTMFDYANWYYASEEEDTLDYDVSYFFTDDEEEQYYIPADEGQELRGLGAQYPTVETIERCAVMNYFDEETYDRINQMWINVRCFNFK